MSEQLAEGMRAKRSSPARLKLEIARIRSIDSGRRVLVFEGKDDKLAYRSWIRRCGGHFSYEPLVGDGKDNLLALTAMLARDRTGSFRRVYFFVDHDFDGLRGSAPNADLFCTDMYSIENYLVHEDVVDGILIDYFNCHGQHEIRDQVIGAFATARGAFQNLLGPINERIFMARSLSIRIKGGIPDLGAALGVDLAGCSPRSPRFEQFRIDLEREPTSGEALQLKDAFGQLDPGTEHRGKFAFEFLQKWFRRLCDENNSSESAFFGGLKRKNLDTNLLTLAIYALYSPMPAGLDEFVERIAA